MFHFPHGRKSTGTAEISSKTYGVGIERDFFRLFTESSLRRLPYTRSFLQN